MFVIVTPKIRKAQIRENPGFGKTPWIILNTNMQTSMRHMLHFQMRLHSFTLTRDSDRNNKFYCLVP